MTVTEKLAHAAERKAFETMLDSLIRKSRTQDVGKVADDLVSMVQRIHSSVWEPETFAMLHKIANDPNSKWAHYAERLLRECDPYLLRTFLTAAAYEGGFRGYPAGAGELRKIRLQHPVDRPHGPDERLQYALRGLLGGGVRLQAEPDLRGDGPRADRGRKALGTHACLFTGGEPLDAQDGHYPSVRKAPRHRLPRLHQRHAHRRGVLRRAASAWATSFVSVSIEGFEDANDGRRGDGPFPEGARGDGAACTTTAFRSACPSATRARTTRSSRATSSSICSSPRAAYFAWYFHYMPVGMGAATDLLLTPEQRDLYEGPRARDPRSSPAARSSSPSTSRTTASSPDGCMAGGKHLLPHQRRGRRRALRLHPLLRREHPRKELPGMPAAAAVPGVPQGPALQRQPCCAPARCWKTPSCLPEMVKRAGAHSTDLEAPGERRAPVR